MDHPFVIFVKFFEKLTFLTPCVSEVRNASFSETFANLINE